MRGRARRIWITILGAVVIFAWYFEIPGLAYYWASMQSRASEWKDRSVWLPRYRVAVEALPIQGISGNASDLTFNTQTGTLFAVINRPPQVAELTTDGRLLRLMPLAGAADVEGITHVGGERYIIADEETNRLHWIHIGPDTTSVTVLEGSSLELGIHANASFGLEGVSWDHAEHRLFVVKEKLPRRIFAVDGLKPVVEGGEGGKFDLQIREWKSAGDFSLFLTDLSGITLVERTGTALVLSDMSALLVEYAPDGTPVSLMPLWPGLHGLSARVPQAEGVAHGPDGALYLLSEPNLFYRFERS